MLAAVAWWFYSRSPARIDSLAVMPFSNQQAGREQEYLSDGITESLISQLSQLPDLSVISRNSVFAFKGKQIDVRDLAQTLGVNAVLFGDVRHEGDDVVISTELVDSKTRRQILGRAVSQKGDGSHRTPGADRRSDRQPIAISIGRN